MSNGTKCDVCGAFAIEDQHEGWFALAPLSYKTRSIFNLNTGDLHLCSWTCLGLLAVEQAGFKPVTPKPVGPRPMQQVRDDYRRWMT